MIAYFGALSISAGYLTLDQLAQAVAIQRQEDEEGLPHRKIGEICQSLGYLDERQISTLLKRQKELYKSHRRENRAIGRLAMGAS